MKKWLIAGGAVVVLGLVVFLSLRGKGGEEGVEVTAEAVARREIRRVVKASGSVDPRVKVNLSAHVVGRIEHLYVQEGDTVESGQAVLQLEQQAFLAARSDWRARLAQARTEVRQAQVDLENARLRQQRMERLSGQGVISQEDRETAELAATSAQLWLEQARESVSQTQANLSKAEDDLRKTTIYSPLSGRVIDLNAEQGEVVVSGTMNNPASVIATIADLSEILAEVDVDETEIVYVQPGQEGMLRVDAVPDRTYRGRVVEVGSSGFSRANQPDVTFFKTKLLFLDPDASLKPGMSVRAEIVTASHPDALVVPIQAVVEREAKPGEPHAAAGGDDETVQVVYTMEDGKAVRHPVTTGIADATHVEVLGGVEPGAQVVSGPYRTLRDLEEGDAVKVKKEAGSAEKSGAGDEGDTKSGDMQSGDTQSGDTESGDATAGDTTDGG